jgi:excisionase family DNA binding protein
MEGERKDMTKSQATLSVPAAARQLGFTLKYVYDLVYAGKLKAQKVDGRWQIPIAEVEARLRKRGGQ